MFHLFLSSDTSLMYWKPTPTERQSVNPRSTIAIVIKEKRECKKIILKPVKARANRITHPEEQG